MTRHDKLNALAKGIKTLEEFTYARVFFVRSPELVDPNNFESMLSETFKLDRDMQFDREYPYEAEILNSPEFQTTAKQLAEILSKKRQELLMKLKKDYDELNAE